MLNDWLVVHEGLAAAGRFRSLARPHRRITAAELLLLLSSGAIGAAAVGFAKLGLRIPGHAIVLAVVPMAFGLAVAPRHLAGSVMSAGALAMALLLSPFGASYGAGSMVSLTLIGPLMDFALRGVRNGWRLYLAIVSAGVAANLLALGSRAAAKLLGLDAADMRPFDSWWVQAGWTYALSGAVAGLLGALCWFHFNDRRRGITRA